MLVEAVSHDTYLNTDYDWLFFYRNDLSIMKGIFELPFYTAQFCCKTKKKMLSYSNMCLK